jgi:hypothetical protein
MCAKKDVESLKIDYQGHPISIAIEDVVFALLDSQRHIVALSYGDHLLPCAPTSSTAPLRLSELPARVLLPLHKHHPQDMIICLSSIYWCWYTLVIYEL